MTLKNRQTLIRLCCACLSCLIVLTLSGCSQIEYGEDNITSSQPPTQLILPEETTTEQELDKYPVSLYDMEEKEFSQSYEAEETEGQETHTALDGYSGEGYVQLEAGEFLSLSVTVPTSQHYRISVRVCSASAKIQLLTGGEPDAGNFPDAGDFPDAGGIAIDAYYIDEAREFSDFIIDGVYLKEGENLLTFYAMEGIAYLDYCTVENGWTVSDSYYSISSSLTDKDAIIDCVKIMQYLISIYGSKTITGQYVTPNTNTEINAVYQVTGRYPAIRSAEINIYQKDSPHYSENNTDFQLAEEWYNSGGLVSYSWIWYSPSEESHYLASSTDFDFSNVSYEERLGQVSLETVKSLYGEGTITEETYLLIQDIDNMAEQLRVLSDAKVPVLFRPLPEAGRKWYWWGTDSDCYKWLWRTMVERFSYLGLHNIIWVWNGENPLFYPGDDYVDIVSEDIYENTFQSGNTRFMSTRGYSTLGKAIALSECAFAPNPDLLYRDNSMWLWFSVWRGDYIINPDGSFSDAYISAEALEYAYNHKLFITREELEL